MVRCKDCGYLARRNNYNDELVSAGIEYRKTGELTGPQNTETGYAPWCSVDAAELRESFIAILRNQTSPSNNASNARIALAVIQEERECSAFTRFRSGFTPKEHLEMQHNEELRREAEERRRADTELAQARLESDREWRRREEQDRRAWQEKEERSRRWFQFWTAVFISVAGAVLTILAEPWKAKKEQPTPQINVTIPPEVFKK